MTATNIWTSSKALKVLESFDDHVALNDFPGLTEFLTQLPETLFQKSTYWNLRKLELTSQGTAESVNQKPFFSILGDILMVQADLASKLWTNYLEIKFQNIDIENIESIPIQTWNMIRQEYLFERKQTWKLLQELIRIVAVDSSSGVSSPSKSNSSRSSSSAAKSPFEKIMDTITPRRLLDILHKHLDCISHWYPLRFSYDQLGKILNPRSSSSTSASSSSRNTRTSLTAEQQKEFIYQHKLEWIHFTLNEILCLLDTMISFTYKNYHLTYKQLESITRILLSDHFNKLTSLWTNYCPVQSSQQLHAIKLSIEKINLKFVLLFAESLQFWRVFLTAGDNGGSDMQLQSHPLSDPKDPIPAKDMINICKNANLNQLMITSGAASPSHAGNDGNSNALVVVSDAVTSNSSSGQHGIVHKSTRTMLIYLWIKFLQTYQGIESEEDDWNQTLSSDNDILDDSIEENLLDHFVKLLKMSYAVEFASLTSASSSSSVAGDAGTKYLFSIHGTILNEMLSVFLKFRVLRDCYTTSEINDLPDAIALIQIIYSKQVELGELFVINWEMSQSFGKEEIAAMFPLVDFIQTMIQFTSSEPIHLLKVMHALIASSSTAPAILERIATVLFTILNQSTNYITNEPFEFLKKIDSKYLPSPTSRHTPSKQVINTLMQNGVWIEQIESELFPFNTKVVYCHEQNMREDVNIHGGLWSAENDVTNSTAAVSRGIGGNTAARMGYDEADGKPFNSVHWYENSSGDRFFNHVPDGKATGTMARDDGKNQFSIRGPFYSSTGSLLSIDYDRRQCQILWDEKFSWLENLLDHLIIKFFQDDTEEDDEESWQLAYSILEIFSFFFTSPSFTTNLQFSFHLNNLWNKISWNYLLKSCHLSHYTEEIISLNIPTKLFYQFLQQILRQSIPISSTTIEEMNVIPDVDVLKTLIERFFSGNYSVSFQSNDLLRLTQKMREIFLCQAETPAAVGSRLSKSNTFSALFSPFNEILVSLLVSRLSLIAQQQGTASEFSRAGSSASEKFYSSAAAYANNAGIFSPNDPLRRKLFGLSSSAGNRGGAEESADYYHLLVQFFHIVVSLTKASSSNNFELCMLIVQELTKQFSEKWLIALNQLIESISSLPSSSSSTGHHHHHHYSWRLRLKTLYYQFLSQLAHHFSLVTVKSFQKFENLSIRELIVAKVGHVVDVRSLAVEDQALYIRALVLVSNLEAFMSSELENLMSLDTSAMNVYSIPSSQSSSSAGPMTDGLTQRRLLADYLHYFQTAFSLYSQLTSLYLSYDDLVAKRKLVVSKEKIEIMFETVLLFSLLLQDYVQWDYFLFKRDASNRSKSSSSSGGAEKKNSMWKDFLSKDVKAPPTTSPFLPSDPADVLHTNENAAIQSLNLPFPYEMLMENRFLAPYLQELLAITGQGFQFFSLLLSFNEAVFQNYSEIIQQVYHSCLETSPSHFIRFFQSFFSCHSSVISSFQTPASLLTPSMSNEQQQATRYHFNHCNNFLSLFSAVSFSLKQFHAAETQQVRCLSLQILSKLINFTELYYPLCLSAAASQPAATSSNLVFNKKTLIEMIGNANLFFINDLLVQQLKKKKQSSSLLSSEEQVLLWTLLSNFLEFHPNIMSLMFSFHSSPLTNPSSSNATGKGKGGSLGSMADLLNKSTSSKKGGGTDDTDSNNNNLLYILLEMINSMDVLYKERPFLLYSFLSFFIKLVNKSKLFPLLGKIVVFLISQDKFWDQVLKPLLNPVLISSSSTSSIPSTTSSGAHGGYNKPTHMLNDFMASYESMLRQDLFHDEPENDRVIHLQSILSNGEEEGEDGQPTVSTASSLPTAEGDLLKNHPAFHLLHLMTEKESNELSQAIHLYSQQMLILSMIFKILSLERYGIFYELNLELAMKTTNKINNLFISSNHKSKFWNWIQQFLTIHIHHSLLQKTEKELNQQLSLSVKDFMKSSIYSNHFFALQASHFNPLVLLSLSSSSSSAPVSDHYEYLIRGQSLYRSLEQLVFHHFHYEKELSAWQFQFFHGISKNLTYLNLINFHYSLSVVDLSVLFHFKEFLQLFILPGSLVKQFIAKYKQEKQQQQLQSGPSSSSGKSSDSFSLAAGESKLSSPSLAAFSSDGVPSSPAIGAMSPESSQPDASPISLRESSFPGDKRSYEIVNEILKKLTTMVVTSHSVEVHSDRSSPSIESHPFQKSSQIGSSSANHSSSIPAAHSYDDADDASILLSMTSSSQNIQNIQQSLFGLISIHENCGLLVNMIHHQLKAISFKDTNPEKSIVLNRDIGSARLTEDKIEKLLHSILMIFQALFKGDHEDGLGQSSAASAMKNPLFLLWKQDLSQPESSLLDELLVSSSSSGSSSPVSHAMKLLLRRVLKHFFFFSSTNSTANLSLNQLLSCFAQMVFSSGHGGLDQYQPQQQQDRDEEILVIFKRLPFSYFKYQIKSSLFTSMLLLLNAAQYHSQKTAAGLSSAGNMLSMVAGKQPSSISALSEVQFHTDNRLMALEFSFHYFKELMTFFGIFGFVAPHHQAANSSLHPANAFVPSPTSRAHLPLLLKQIHHLLQILSQIMKISLPKPTSSTSSTSSSSNNNNDSSSDFLLNPLHYKQLLSFFMKEDFFAYLLELMNYLTSFITNLPQVENNYSGWIRSSSTTPSVSSSSSSSSLGSARLIDENELKIDVHLDTDYLSLSGAVMDISPRTTSNFPQAQGAAPANTTIPAGTPVTNAASSSPLMSENDLVSSENILHGVLSIYDLLLYSLDQPQHAFLSFTQELAFYQRILAMVNQSALLQEFQKTLLSPAARSVNGSTPSVFVSSLFMGYHSITRRESLVNKVWQKTLHLVEMVLQKLFAPPSSSSSSSSSSNREEYQADISQLTQQLIQFLSTYESLLLLPLLGIGVYRYTIQQLQLIRQVFQFFRLFHLHCPIYKTFLPNIPVFLEMKSLQFLSNISFYCFYSEDFFIESQQINLLTTGVIVNGAENIPFTLPGASSSGLDENHPLHALLRFKDEAEQSAGAGGGEEKRDSSASNLASSRFLTAGAGGNNKPPSFTSSRNASVESAHVHFGSDQLFLISGSSTAENASASFLSPSGSRTVPRQLSTPIDGTPGNTVKPVSILKNSSKKFSDPSLDKDYDLSDLPPPAVQPTPATNSHSSKAPSLDRGLSLPPSALLSSRRSTGLAMESRHLDRGADRSVSTDYYYGANPPPSAVNASPVRYRFGHYHYSHPFLSFIFLLEKALFKSLQTIQHYVQLIVPSADGPHQENLLLLSEDAIAQKFPIGMKIIFHSRQTNTLVEGIIQQFLPATKSFDVILLANNLLEKNIQLAQLKYYQKPLVFFHPVQDLRQRTDFYSFPVINATSFFHFPMAGGGAGMPMRGSLGGLGGMDKMAGAAPSSTAIPTAGNVIAAYDHLYGKVDQHRILSTAHLARVLQYLMTIDTKDRLVAAATTTTAATTSSPATSNDNTTTTTSSAAGSKGPGSSQAINQRLQSLQNSFSLREYLQLLRELVHLTIFSLHHHSYAPMGQELPMIQQLIDLQHLFSSFHSDLLQQHQDSGNPSSSNNNNSNPSNKNNGLPGYLAEWKDFLSLAYSWMEEIYYRLEQSIGIDLTDNLPTLVTPMKKDGKFRKGLRTPSNWFTDAQTTGGQHDTSMEISRNGGYLRKMASSMLREESSARFAYENELD